MLLRNRELEILAAIVGRPVYVSLLLEYPSAQKQMLELCAASQWFTNELARYPILLDELLDSQELFRQNDREQLTTVLDRLMSQVDQDDLEQQMERLRQFRRTEIFKLAATDVIHVHEIWDVGAKLSTVADVVLEKVLRLSWDAVCKRHGIPVCTIEGEKYHPGMAVIAYGKLGGLEMGYGSDLDIVFPLFLRLVRYRSAYGRSSRGIESHPDPGRKSYHCICGHHRYSKGFHRPLL